MKLLFKEITSPSGTALVKHYNFRDFYPGVHLNTNWDTLKPFIQQAAIDYIFPYLTEDLYDKLADDYEADTVPTEVQSVLERLQVAIANYAMYDALPTLNVSLGEMGVQQKNDMENVSVSTNQWSFHKARQEALRKGDRYLDLAMDKVAEQAQAELSYLDDFVTSKAWTDRGSNFIRSTAVLNEYVNIQNSHRAFIALSRYVRKAEEQYIKPILCSDLFDELADQVKGGSLTADNEKLLVYVRSLAAEYGLYEGIPHLTVLIEGDGLRFVSASDGITDKRNMVNAQHAQAIDALKYRAEENARTARADLINFLYAKKDTYPLFADSDCYLDPDDLDNQPPNPTDHVGGVWL